MNKSNEKEKREIYIMLGFLEELFFFLMSGYAFAFGENILSILSFFMGIFIAWKVGSLIKKNSIENYKWSLD